MARRQTLDQRIIACRRCPRLIRHIKQIARERRRAYANEVYWGQPVPNFGPARARVLIVGLAPAAHGANRTGRVFTGDRSGEWLYRALYRAGLSSQAEATSRNDGLRLLNCAITAVCHCAPPQNLPTPDEIGNCRPWLEQTITSMRPRVIVALGGIAWRQTIQLLKTLEWVNGMRMPPFSHGAHAELRSDRHLLGSYHPSQQNTFTGKLTEPMLDALFARAVELAKSPVGGSAG
jgi:uracil-DNA glycosylase family 4